jgi:hypothetical protein
MTPHRRPCSLLAALTLFAALAGTARAEPGDDLAVSVLTFGPHEHPFFKFGHNAILVRQGGAPGLVFNFGTFQFDSIDLLPKFLRGRVTYWLSVSPEGEALEYYTAANRSIVQQELALSPAAKLRLWEALKENAKPINRGYLYDYFRDNCSTRVRDAIDVATDGAIKRVGSSMTTATFRDHALRMTADYLPEYLGLYLVLGRRTDVPLNRWQEAFLPEKFQELIRDVRIPGPSGQVPLVRKESLLFAARREPPLKQPPKNLPYFLLVGVALGGVFALLGRAAGRKKRLPRVTLGILLSLAGLLAGLIGLFFLLFWGFTDHVATHANANILQLPVLALGFVYYGIRVALGGAVAMHRAYWLARICLGLSFLGILVKILPGLNQDNVPIIATCLPIWLGLAVGLRYMAKNMPTKAKKRPRK